MRLIDPDDSWTGWSALARLFDVQYAEFLAQGYALPIRSDAGLHWAEEMRRLDRSTRFFRVALDEREKIVGFAEASVARAPAWKGGDMIGRLRHIWVAPEKRRGEVGAKLMAASMDWLNQHAAVISHEVIASNAAANRFWERQEMTLQNRIYERVFVGAS
ncbi:GNAT family N-acetyltransferase [Brevundimonas lutea]|uniref:GNAT family N-acetyltransferase n=1 Tax=Brevundimonas lutea TaxID=2293980 RepID=UPI000F024408|nr:GNAT family N-acetyltransferase [Brevundimonas lutea]